jgi:PAS domain S-box-containing protein
MDSMIATHEQIEQTVWYLTVVADQAMGAIVVVDFSGVIQFVNTAWARMHGYEDSRELIGKSINLFHTEEQMKTDVIPFIEEVKRRGQLAGPVEHIRRNGAPFTTEMLMVILRDRAGKALGLIGFAADITGNENIIAELEQYRNHLAELVELRTHELKVINDQLQREITEREEVEKYIRQQVDELTAVNKQLQGKIDELSAKSDIAEANVFETISPNETAVPLSDDEEILAHIFRENVELQKPELVNGYVEKSISEKV